MVESTRLVEKVTMRIKMIMSDFKYKSAFGLYLKIGRDHKGSILGLLIL